MKKMMWTLLLSSALANSNELNNLINTSDAIVDQMKSGVMMVGSAIEYSYQGNSLSDGTAHLSAQISTAQVQAYNNALMGMSSYMPYGDIKQTLESKADDHLELMDEAIDVFTGAVVQMTTVQQVSEMATEAATPNEEEQVQEYVTSNVETLQISQETVDDYNQSLVDIETNANKASSFIAVANNTEAVEFLRQGAENNNTTADMATVSYNANQQWVSMNWGNGNATAVFLNGQNFGIDLYVSTADILTAGSESEFYTTSPLAYDYDCYFEQEC